jgi:hypothetical protein
MNYLIIYYKIIFFTLLLCCQLLEINAQQFNTPVSIGGGIALGQVQASLQGKDALFNQIAGMLSIENSIIGISTQNRYLLPEINQGSIATGIRINPNLLFYSKIDYLKHYDLIHQQYSLGLGRKLGMNASLGIALKYQFLSLLAYGKTATINSDLFVSYKITEDWSMGFIITNLLPFNSNEEVSSYAEIGINYTISNKIQFNSALSKELSFAYNFHLGIHYQPIEKIGFKVGYFTEPGGLTLGIQYSPTYPITLEFATISHHVLGNSPSIVLLYCW